MYYLIFVHDCTIHISASQGRTFFKVHDAEISYFFIFRFYRGERQALRAAKDIAELLDGESLFTYCSPYKRAIGTWDIIEDYLEDNNRKSADKTDGTTSSEERDCKSKKTGVEIIGMREEPRVAEQQFGNFREYLSYIIMNI